MSLATATGRYPAQLERLRESVRASGFTGDLLFWQPGALPPGCPPHDESPFAFKPFAFAEARRRGNDLALWLDASCVVVRPLDEVFTEIAGTGYVVFANGQHRVGEWASDVALVELGLTRDQALRIPEINAAAIGFDLHHPAATRFLDEWIDRARAGVAFRGTEAPILTRAGHFDVKWNVRGRVSPDRRVRGHRHDQTVAGVLTYRLGMSPVVKWVESSSGGRPRRPDTIVVIDRDGGRPAAIRALAGFVRRHPSLAAFVRRARRLTRRLLLCYCPPLP